MIAAARKAKRQLGIGYRQHFEPYNLEMIRIARARELGALKFIDATAGTIPVEPNQWRLDKKLAGGGSMVDIGIYALQAVRTISGEEPVSVSARATITDPREVQGHRRDAGVLTDVPERHPRVVRQHLRRARQPRRRRRRRRPLRPRAGALLSRHQGLPQRRQAVRVPRHRSVRRRDGRLRRLRARRRSRPACPARKGCATSASSTPFIAPPPPAAT